MSRPIDFLWLPPYVECVDQRAADALCEKRWRQRVADNLVRRAQARREADRASGAFSVRSMKGTP